MDAITVSLTLIGSGGVLWAIGRSFGHKKESQEVMLMKEEMARKIQVIQAEYPGLPAFPDNPGAYRGWWQEAKQRFRLQVQSKTLAEQQILAKQMGDLQEEYVRYAKATREGRQTARDIEDDEELHSLILAIKKANLTADLNAAQKRSEAPAPPAAPSDAEKIQAENETIKAEIARDKLKAEREAIKNAQRPAPKPPPEDPTDKVIRELRLKQMQRAKIMKAAEEMANDNPSEKDRIMRDAQKAIEALRDRS